LLVLRGDELALQDFWNWLSWDPMRAASQGDAEQMVFKAEVPVPLVEAVKRGPRHCCRSELLFN
jgi:hypothetical protein